MHHPLALTIGGPTSHKSITDSPTCYRWAALTFTNYKKVRSVSFPHEAIRGLGFFSAQVDAYPHHEWPKATSDEEMHHRVLRKSLTQELPHVEKAFSNKKGGSKSFSFHFFSFANSQKSRNPFLLQILFFRFFFFF